jgi:N,N-dimethylformamidase
MGTLDPSGDRGWQIVFDRARGLGLRISSPGGQPVVLWSETPVASSRWTHLTVAADAGADIVTLAQADAAGEAEIIRGELAVSAHRPADLLVVGAPQNQPRPVSAAGNGCFNGKISAPIILAEAIQIESRPGLRDLASIPRGADAALVLDLADPISGPRFEDRSRHRHPAVAVNMPTAGVTGPTWNGSSSSYLEARDEYDAVHFHDDDLEDSLWDVAFELDLPDDLPNGVYAARLATEDCTDDVPFIVTTPGRTSANAVLILPTLTYLAYANEHEILSNPPSYEAFTGRKSEQAPLTWRDVYAVEEGLLSLYDVHRDGSTVSYASLRRPLVNLRPDYTWPLLDGPHGLAVDLRLIGWLERSGFEIDLLTDHDLHAAGSAALDPYRVMITGGHPEYWTAEMLDALEAYVAAGGRMLYLGGNGLHGVAGIDPARPHVAEVRRPQIGSRPSSSAPGELWMTTSGQQGGQWRHRGRGPHQHVGVGTAAMGAGPGRPYRRSEVSREPRNSWVFDGVAGDEFGDGGEICGAAAAYEFDRTDHELGTPATAEVLATATGFESLYYPVLEDFVGSTPEIADPGSPLVRADMVMMIGANGGGSFSVGSAAWCASLVDADEQPTETATITANVLTRFLATPRGADPLAAGMV